ncbi:hypothetical protein PT015_12020 [Candidatus Mycobacterium wuenschmannii]|uniref:Uncharacterized protein n=1 Tax=Candidatus Mycobacterium wuenschmannii TaxID=3027808 RepID=A0ABY8W4U1_9MYCO|nr:hypothetical protein [Candidatus Mycobacterium wuenschmannii]WIM90081.1 hypothetical protein PT015_12020 [Candidatus Mycobacterium wuenschmannii]
MVNPNPAAEDGQDSGASAPTVFIATPMYGGTATATYTWSLAQTPVIFMRSGIGLLYQYRTRDALVTNSRNHLATQFLETQATHLMWIDADIGFNGLDIVSMLVADQDIVCGIYPKKGIDWKRVAQAANDGVPPEELHRHTGTFVVKPLAKADENRVADSDEVVEIAAGGTGFMLIKRAVFEALQDHVPSYEIGGATVKEFYATDIDPETRQLIGEDYYFCLLARSHGFGVYAAPWVRLSHTGPYEYASELQPNWLVNPGI